MQWEVKTVRAYDRHEFEKTGERIGQMGWELVSAQVDFGIRDVYIGFFKRPRK